MQRKIIWKNGNCLICILLITAILFCNQLSASAQTWSITPEEKAMIDFHLGGAKMFAREGRYNEAEALYKEILKVEPTNTDAHYGLGKTYLFEKKYNEAKICYIQTGKLGIKEELLPAYFFNLSLIDIGLRNNKEAISDLRQCLSFKPDYKSAKELLILIEVAYKRDGNNSMITIDRPRP